MPPPAPRPAPADAPRRQRLLRLHQEVAALRGQLTGIREAAARLAAVEATRSFTLGERRRVARPTLH